jgi:universal stress protein A
MTTVSKILVPLDFLPHSAEAVHRALDLASRYSAEVVLLHVYQPAEYPMLPGDIVYDEPRLEQIGVEARARIEAVRRDVDPLGRRVTTRVVQGAPARVIVDLASSEPFDLIVMGTHGRTGMGRIVRGSIAEEVVRRAPCGVLTVKSPRSPVSGRFIGAPGVSRRPASVGSELGAPSLAIARAFSKPWR